MKIKLLNDGMYPGFDNVEFPVEVEAELYTHGYRVHYEELERIGADMKCFYDPLHPFWPWLHDEVELLP